MVDMLRWRIVTGESFSSTDSGFPEAVVTTGPPFRHESMPDEVAVLLPTNAGPTRLIERVIDSSTKPANVILGLFLASPFLNVKVESARLLGAGIHWMTNLPSVAQQDVEFSQQLTDVELGFDRELECLAQFRSEGFRTAATVADARTASAAAAAGCDAMIVLPRVSDFAAGFPSLRQRSTSVRAVIEAAQAAGWSGTVLGLGEARDADNEGLWPNGLDGLICRPVAG